jgi:hypothetical protein
MRLLLNHGADINAADENGRTAVIIFCSSMNPSLEGLQLLIDWGARLNARDGEGESSLDRLALRPYLAHELSDLLRRAGAKSYRGMAEKGGFEPPTEVSPCDGLANRCFRPLSHLSAVHVVVH